MKRVFIAVGILLLLPVFIILSQLYVKNSTEDMAAIVTEAQSAVKRGDLTAARGEINKFDSEWKKRSAVLETFIRHSEIDTLNADAARLLPFLDHGEDGPDADFYASCEAITMQLEHIRKTESLSLSNIF